MAPYRYCNRLVLPVIMLSLCSLGCDTASHRYSGSEPLTAHPWLTHKKVFLDPGHGGGDPRDRFRTGPNGITESSVNLGVALILADMLKTAGAVVELSRSGDISITDYERANKARACAPDLLVSIHHRGSAVKESHKNYPGVLIWGSREAEPASYDCALHLIDEFNKLCDEKGSIASDFLVNEEGGTSILRETRHLCPGVIGEAGFYTNIRHSVRLRDKMYLEKEAEAYFHAISRYFKWGLPTAEVHFSCPVKRSGYHGIMISDEKPIITIAAWSGNELAGINEKSLRITLDGIPVGHRKISENMFSVDYGRVLYPGLHRLRFQFRNLRDQSSMLLTAPFAVKLREGDVARLAAQGRKLVREERNTREGLKMLLSALSLDPMDPCGEAIIRDIVRGFSIIGEHATADYYRGKLSLIYGAREYRDAGVPSRASAKIIMPIEYFGKQVRVRETSCCEKSKKEK